MDTKTKKGAKLALAVAQVRKFAGENPAVVTKEARAKAIAGIEKACGYGRATAVAYYYMAKARLLKPAKAAVATAVTKTATKVKAKVTKTKADAAPTAPAAAPVELAPADPVTNAA